MEFFIIHPSNLIQSLSLALDMVVDGANAHQFRTAVICKHIADEIRLDSAQQQVLLNAAFLHDIGAASDREEQLLLACPEEEERLGQDIFTHAEKGWALLESSLCFRGAPALAVRHHHDWWQGGSLSGCRGNSIPLESRIILVADRVEVNIKKNQPVLGQRREITEVIAGRSGTQFDPDVVDAFLSCSDHDGFWLDIMHPELMAPLMLQVYGGPVMFTAGQLLSIAGMFATLIDSKSVFTATHSKSVANVAVSLARQHGLSKNEQRMMKIAGYLHDLGKLAVSNDILEKPGPLTAGEMEEMHMHSYYTHRILARMEGVQRIAHWAAFHHETMDGAGYPFGINGDELPLGSRIMAIADIFVALAEDRPYRKRMDAASISRIMRGMAQEGKLDSFIINSLFDVYAEVDSIVVASGKGEFVDRELEGLPEIMSHARGGSWRAGFA